MRAFFDGVRAVIYAGGFIAFFWWFALNIQRFDPTIGGGLPSLTEIPGVILMIPGGILALTCVVVFVLRGRGTAAPFDPPRQFVAIGPYKVVRNPMYVGGLAALLGFGLSLRSLTVSGLAAVVGLLLHLFVLIYEEPDLERRFGSNYLEYKKRVNRWIPRWK
jgi:protein-S-isoprenylcysteine O-methyltransferase Ste14